MNTFIQKKALVTAIGVLFLASSAWAINPNSNKPTAKSDWKFGSLKVSKAQDNSLLDPTKVELPNQKEVATYETATKFDLVPVVQDHVQLEIENNQAEGDEIAEGSIDSALNSTGNASSNNADGFDGDFNSNLPSPKNEGDAVLENDAGKDASVEGGSLQEASYTEGTGKPNTSGLKLPEFDSLFGSLGENKATEETVPSDPNSDEEIYDFYDDAEDVSAELDVATTTVKAKIVLQYTEGSFVDNTLNADLLKDGAVVISSKSATFNPSETVTGKGTVTFEFDSSDNFSFNDFDNLVLTTTDTFSANVVSYSVVIDKKVTDNTELASSSTEETIPLSFVTDISDAGLFHAEAYTTSIKIKQVLQYEDGETFVDGSLDSTVSNSVSTLIDFGTGQKSFKESSSVEGKGTFTVYYASASGIDFNRITHVDLKTDGSFSGTIVNHSVEIEKKVKPSDTTFTATEETDTLSLTIF